MRRISSLTMRLVVYLLLSQAIACLAAWSFIYAHIFEGVAYNFDFELTDLAYPRARDLVIESIVPAPGGSLRVEPNSALRALIERNPTLKFAAFDAKDGSALRGSSPKLVAALGAIGEIRARYIDFGIVGDPMPSLRGTMMKWHTPFGLFYIAVYGFVFQWADLLYYFMADFQFPGTYFAAIFTVSTAVTWFAIRQGLKPLQTAADQAGCIDLDSLGQGIATTDAPTEIKPLIDAMNRSLARLNASAARMRRFTANAAHELRTPVAILRARLENPAEPTLQTDLMRDACRIQAIVEQMLIAARMTEGQAALDQKIELGEAIWQIVADYTPLVIESGRQLEYETSEAPVLVQGNQQAIECVVANLIENAVRAEPFGGKILVRVHPNAVIAVIDHGKGIAKDDREKIFEPFWRKEDKTPGSGLGLAIAKELMDMLGGRIWLEETPGGGAMFKVSLPQVETNVPLSPKFARTSTLDLPE